MKAKEEAGMNTETLVIMIFVILAIIGLAALSVRAILKRETMKSQLRKQLSNHGGQL